MRVSLTLFPRAFRRKLFSFECTSRRMSVSLPLYIYNYILWEKIRLLTNCTNFPRPFCAICPRPGAKAGAQLVPSLLKRTVGLPYVQSFSRNKIVSRVEGVRRRVDNLNGVNTLCQDTRCVLFDHAQDPALGVPIGRAWCAFPNYACARGDTCYKILSSHSSIPPYHFYNIIIMENF